MSTYPGALDNFDSDHTDEPTRLVGPDLDDIAAAVNNIEAELGLDPAGAAATVVARLDDVDADAADLADAITTILTTLTGKQDAATAATDAELAAAVATINSAIALKQDAATAATDAELAAGLAGKADLVGGVVPTAQIPAIASGQTVTVASQAAMLALTAAQVQPGDVAIRTDLSGRRFLLADADPAILANWIALETPDAVSSVNGQQGVVVLGFSDVGAASTTDPRLSDQRTPTDASVTSAKLANDLALPGNPTAPTQAQGNDTSRLATTAFTQAACGLLIPKSVADAAGDLLIASANDTVTRLPAPTTTGHVLTADTGEALKMAWAPVPAPVASWFHATGTGGLVHENPLGTLNKMVTGTVVTDTESWWDATNTRYVPQVAGLYLVTAAFNASVAYQASTLWTDIGWFRNGLAGEGWYVRTVAGTTAWGPIIAFTGVVYMNGSADYIEACGGVGRITSATTLAGTTALTVVLLASD